ncbi:MAG: 3-phosphoserine/phosphohydroxythreonine transaminase [Treponema sp.]|nr:3-phosphoserine/phosphohydroxythreonine transaminase [Treponema sp.]
MRVFNFSAGPSVLPLSVLEKAAKEITDANGTGQSVMEMSHRSKDFVPIIEKTESLLRDIMKIPANYKVLFLQGGAWTQFAMVPLNLGAVEFGAPRKKATYIDSGIWATKSAEEAAKYVDVTIGASSADRSYRAIPAVPPHNPNDDYYHFVYNNTLVGTKWPSIPDTGSVPLVSDISSFILSEPLDVSKFGLLYAGAQKNLGPAGTTLVIVREDLVGRAPSWVPTMLQYKTHAAEASLFNTPPCYGIYMIGLVLEWLQEQGGAEAMGQRNREKAELLYACLEESKFFHSPVEKSSRSLMNIVFFPRESDPEKCKDIENRFVKEAAAAGLVNLAGHRLMGGLRASIYNAMPIEGVKALIDFIKKFELSL